MSDAAREPEAVGSGRYSLVAILLHWAIALAIVMQVSLAGRMEGPPTPESFAVTQLHKSIGITILLLSLARLAWRLTHPPPPLPATMSRWEQTLAKVTHVGFYVIMIGMPLTGWLMVSTSRIAVPTLLYGAVPWPNLPVGDVAPAAKAIWHEVGKVGHGAIAKAIYVLLALHVAGALKHQLFSRDEPVLARMAPGAVAGRWLEPRLLAILLAVGGVFVFAKLVQPPRPGMAPPPSAAAAQEPVEAQGPAEPAKPTAPPVAETPQRTTWAVLPGSTISFATAWSGAPVKGRFDRWRANIVFDPEHLDRSRATVSIDVVSVNTGDAQRDAALPAPDWFDTAHHPTAIFTARRFEKKADGRYVAHGTLQLRGVSRPLDLPFALEISGDAAKADGVASLDRTAFGVGQGEWAATDQIPAKVSVGVHIRAKRQDPSERH